MESLSSAIGTIKNNVINAIAGPSEAHAISKAEVLALEEHERLRRLEQVAQTRVDKQNAANISYLIKGQHYPVFRGNLSRGMLTPSISSHLHGLTVLLVTKGYKKFTTKWEEEERRRRLTNKSESALRRTNANKTARMIQNLGWPFIKHASGIISLTKFILYILLIFCIAGPEYIVMDFTKSLEEEEREWRMSNSYWTGTAKHNAAVVANILRWNNFQANRSAGTRRFVRILEEKERSYRLSPNAFNTGMQNAYRESGLIRHMGMPFYIQGVETFKRGNFHSIRH